MHTIHWTAIIAALSLAICQSAMAQSDPSLGLVDAQATDFAHLDALVHPPRSRLSLLIIPERPENALPIATREECIQQHGQWSYQRVNEHAFRVGCAIQGQAEGLWFYTSKQLTLTPKQKKAKKTFDDVFNLSELPHEGYGWYLHDMREGWEFQFDPELGFVKTVLQLHEDKPNGIAMMWDKFGKLDTAAHFVDGKRDGVYEEYDNGRPYKFGQYSHGKPIGVWEIYRDGMLYQRIDYDNTIAFGDIRNIVMSKTNIPSLYESIDDAQPLYWMEDYGNNERKYKSGYAMEDENGNIGFYGDVQYYMSTGEPWFVISMHAGRIDDKFLKELCPRDSFGGFYTDADKRLTCKDAAQNEYRVLQYYENGQINAIVEFARNDVRHGVVTEYHRDGKLMADYRMNNGFPERGDLSYRDPEGNAFQPESEIDFDQKSGILRTFWANGKLRTETTYQNGVRNGIYRQYYANGTLEFEVPYRNDKRDGDLRYWYENGVFSHLIQYKEGLRHGKTEYHYAMGSAKSHEIEYRNDKAAGTEFEYTPKGGIQRKLVHDEADRTKLHIEEYGEDNRLVAAGDAVGEKLSAHTKVGIWKYYLPDGSVWFTQNWDSPSPEVKWCEKRGGSFRIDAQNRAVGCSEEYPNRKTHQHPQSIRSGKWRWYTAQGTIEKEGAFRYGELDGEWTFYYPNGRVMLKGEYAFGVKTGAWQSYYENGVTRFAGNYKDGSEDGEWTTYYPKSGKVSSRGNFQAGIREGEWSWYYENGQVETNGTFSANQETGAWTTYYDSGEKLGEGDFVAGNREGTWTWWRADGRVWRTAEFVEGREKSPTGRESQDVPQTALLQWMTKPNK